MALDMAYFIDNAMAKHLMKLAQKVTRVWKVLAIFLDVSNAKQDEISLNNKESVVLQAYEMLNHWWVSKGKHARSWRDELRDALGKIERSDLVKDFTGNVLQT
jgi:FtsZ-binding cell division protein ZapB